MKKLIALLFILTITIGHCDSDTCSRIAVINYQEVLIDSSSSKPGDGLRFYLEKDPKAREFLDEYQELSKPSWKSSVISTTGTLMILSGLLSSGDSKIIGSKNFMLLGGLSIITLNYLYSKTQQAKNELLLKRSVDEYNKRNLPKIYFSPFGDGDKSIGVGVGLTKEF